MLFKKGKGYMIKIYTVASCSSCKKAKEWLRKHDLDYEEINLLTDDLTDEELLKILSLTELGTEEIISKRSRAYGRLDINFEELPVSQLLTIIEEHRLLLRRPLIVDDKRLQIGYNEDDIRKFLPRSVRKIEARTASNNIRAEMRLQGCI
jgi:regulatory protein spx